mmetsp:Transcript_178193/g.571201  ORF Transcript_178193/g.571201 Transcript_178193/m.571201 type:complete len:84 (-) Transcript_178193:104-355(-)
MCSSSGRPVVHPTNKGGGLLPCFKLFEGYPYPGERSLAAEQTNPSEDLDFVRDAPKALRAAMKQNRGHDSLLYGASLGDDHMT